MKKALVSLSQLVPVARDDVVGGDVHADGEDSDADSDPQNDHDHDERLVRGAGVWRNGRKNRYLRFCCLSELSKSNCTTGHGAAAKDFAQTGE